jgi:hypothetical protein
MRQVAEWGLQWSDGKDARDELRDIADQVERGDFEDICPMCEEITCDAGCALEPLREGLT